MNGAESLVRTLLANGVDHCFANPGTSEMHLVQAIDKVDEFNAILCLFEGVCTGAADGFARMRGIPATTLLHLGAGLGNGIANLHNCRRAATPLINIVGDHAVHHVAHDAPLTSDIEAVARPVSSWIRTSRTSQGVGIDAADGFRASMSSNPDSLGNISTLIVPADCAWGEGRVARFQEIPAKHEVPFEKVEAVAGNLDEDTILLIDGNGLLADGLKAAGMIAAATRCQIYTPTFPARVESGPNLPAINRLPYFPEHILALLGSTQRLVLAGTTAPVSFFAYQNLPSQLVPDSCEVIHLAHRHEDVSGALQQIAEMTGRVPYAVREPTKPELPEGELSTGNVARILANKIMDEAIVTVDSGGGGAAYGLLQQSVPHSWLNLTGGSIGQSGPLAIGVAAACPNRPVYALLGDGGAMYTNQFLWTAARENMNVVTVIFANQQYNILEVEYLRMGVNQVGERAARLFDLSNPALDWVSIANGMGVDGLRVSSCNELVHALDTANALDGPFLIEAAI